MLNAFRLSNKQNYAADNRQIAKTEHTSLLMSASVTLASERSSFKVKSGGFSLQECRLPGRPGKIQRAERLQLEQAE